MPLYDYHCKKTGQRTEYLVSYEKRAFCPCGCGAIQLMSAPARTAYRWGDTQWDGRYDHGLGTTLRDANHRKQIMQERGLRELQDGEVEAQVADMEADMATHDRNMATFNKHRAETGDVGLAIARTFPAEQMLAEST